MTTVVEIDSLDIEGFSEQEARRAASAFETRLSELLNRHGLPPHKTVSDIGEIRLDQLPPGQGSPEGTGRSLAESLFRRVWE